MAFMIVKFMVVGNKFRAFYKSSQKYHFKP